MNASLGSSNLIRTDSVPGPRKCLPAYRVGTRVIEKYTEAKIFNNILFSNVSLHSRCNTPRPLAKGKLVGKT
jgi:hypothetical protein